MNQRRWEAWFEGHHQQLVPYLLDLLQPEVLEDIEAESLVNRLNEHVVTRELERVALEPEAAVHRWLSAEGLNADRRPDDLLEQAHHFVPRHERVEAVSKATDSGWEPASPSKVDPDAYGDGQTVDQEEVINTMRKQKSIGTDAERAALKLVAAQTRELLDLTDSMENIKTINGTVESGWELLEWPIPDGGVTAQHLHQAREAYEDGGGQKALEQGLHIADVWDGAGYDLIGLERAGDRVLPVRYEIKAISATAPVVGLHLTGKQLSVHDAVKDTATDEGRYAGEWRLWGVERGGDAIDFTDELDRLPATALETLRERGFDHDGLILRVTRGKGVEPRS